MVKTPPPQPEAETELPPLDFEFQEWDEQWVYDMVAQDDEMRNQLQKEFNEFTELMDHDEVQQQHNPSVHDEEMPNQQLVDELNELLSQGEDVDEVQQQHYPSVHDEEMPQLNHEELQQHHSDDQQLPESPPPVQEMVNHAEEAASKYRKGRWNSEEHKLFLMGQKDQPNKWRYIAENYVKTRSAEQVASHAQKYLLHVDPKKTQRVPKRNRKSIFDTTLDDDNHHQQQPPQRHHHDNQHQQQPPQQILHHHHVPIHPINHRQNIVRSPSPRPILPTLPQSQPHHVLLDHDDHHHHQQPPSPQHILDVPPHLLNLHLNIVSSPYTTHPIIFHTPQSQPQLRYQPQLPQSLPPLPHQPLPWTQIICSELEEGGGAGERTRREGGSE